MYRRIGTLKNRAMQLQWQLCIEDCTSTMYMHCLIVRFPHSTIRSGVAMRPFKLVQFDERTTVYEYR